MIAKLEWTQIKSQQNIEQLQNLTIGVTINNKSTTEHKKVIKILHCVRQMHM